MKRLKQMTNEKPKIITTIKTTMKMKIINENENQNKNEMKIRMRMKIRIKMKQKRKQKMKNDSKFRSNNRKQTCQIISKSKHHRTRVSAPY